MKPGRPPLPDSADRRVNVSVTVLESVKRKGARMAKGEGVSFSRFVERLLQERWDAIRQK